MFKRKLYEKMLTWKSESNGASALMIEGARRVGKTTLVKEFAANEYDSFVYIDFSKEDREVANLFENHRRDTNEFLRMLQLLTDTQLTPRASAVIFDEVQRLPIAREYIKHLVEDGRFDYIETGSLISIRKNVADIVIPSEEERLSLVPLDFEEYLWALGKDIAVDAIRDAYESLSPLPDSVHTRYMRLFSEYMLVGGMPQAVKAFAEDGDFYRCDKVKRQILALYSDDIAKFGGDDARRAQGIFREIPGQLSHGSKRFRYSSLGKGTDYRDCESALIWLEDAHLANICRLCSDPNVGFRLSAEGSALKCYMADTGLLVSHVFDEGPESRSIYRDLQFGKISINKGMFVENAIAQQLTARGHKLYYYSWEERPGEGGASPLPREIDFLVTKGFSDAAGKLRVCPIEVKSAKAYKTVSLGDFKRRFKTRVGAEIVLHPKQLKVEGQRMFLPLYMSTCV